jgi:queuine tRNA-ribosyltransferase subunit QTRTD1
MPDLVEQLDIGALELNFQDFYGMRESIQQQGGNLKDTIKSADHLLYLSTRDPLAFPTVANTNEFTSISTPNGQLQVTPEVFMSTVNVLKPDLCACMADEILPTAGKKRTDASVTRSVRWLDMCLEKRDPAAPTPMLGVVVGGVNEDYRRRCAQEMATRDVVGFVVGGLGLGETMAERRAVMDTVFAELPRSGARILSGVGEPAEVLEAVAQGVDGFTSAYPLLLTRFGQVAQLLPAIARAEGRLAGAKAAAPAAAAAAAATGGDEYDDDGCAGPLKSKVNLRDKRFLRDPAPLCPGCECFACRRHTRSYVNHLLNTNEMLADVLLYNCNLHQYLRFFESVRSHLKAGDFDEFRKLLAEEYA